MNELQCGCQKWTCNEEPETETGHNFKEFPPCEFLDLGSLQIIVALPAIGSAPDGWLGSEKESTRRIAPVELQLHLAAQAEGTTSGRNPNDMDLTKTTHICVVIQRNAESLPGVPR